MATMQRKSQKKHEASVGVFSGATMKFTNSAPKIDGLQVTISYRFKSRRALNDFLEDLQMSEDPKVIAQLHRAEKEIKEGKFISLDALCKQHGV